MKIHDRGYVLLPLVLAVGLIAGIFLGRHTVSVSMSPTEQKLRTILNMIENDYVDEIDADSLIETILPDLLTSLDPHSAYISASELKAVNEDLEGSFSGVGVSFQILNDTVTIVEVIAGGPAEKVGLLAGDRILEANGKKLSGEKVTNEDVFSTLRGEKGTKVEMSVKRSSSRTPLKFDVIRGDIPVNSVDSHYMIDDKTGYVKVSKFARNTYQEFADALGDLNEKGAKAYIIDLRGNSGGFMEQAIFMANEFLPKGKMIVYTKGRLPENETMAVSDGSGSYQDAEVVVLTNEYSASASEIFAGAIQDNDRGLVIGRRTFGKGLVQNQRELPDSSAIRLTVARYYTPTGRSIQKEYKRGEDGKYQYDIENRYAHGEFYSADSIKLDKSKIFKTPAGRKVYGGGGIMPDVFVPEDTTGITSYYINVVNRGLVQKFAFHITDRYRSLLKGVRTVDQLFRIIPDDDMLLESFVSFAVKEGVPARWYYINQSRDLLLLQIKSLIARDAIGFDGYYKIYNTQDPTVHKALDELRKGHSPVKITN